MAEYTYTVTVASGNLYGGGTGNVYYLNGARNSTGPGTVNWVQGGTLRFEQSASSNDNHPLIFSTTTSRDQYLTSGVTYYLDGASNYANYVNTTTFNAATTRYVEVTPSSATDFYYLCYVHGIGMGGIFDIESNVWGGLSWGNGVWGDQGHVDVSVTGISLTSTIGNETHVIDHQVTAVGQQLTSSIGTPVGGTSALVSVTGSLESMAVGQTLVGIGAITSGVSMSSSIGAATVDESTLTGEGWGRAAWGEFAWGVNYSVALTGQTLTSSIGEEAGFTDVTVSVTGSSLTSTQGIISLVGDFGIVVLPAEDQLDFTIGSVSFEADANVTVTSAGSITSQVGNAAGGLKTPVDVTGIQLTSTIGTITLQQTTIEPVTGQQLAMSLGQHDEIPGQIIGVGGLQLTSSVGSVTAVGSSIVDVTGIQFTSSVGSPNITAWAEINPGVNNIWTEVDRAA
tara:strand:+ start:449 stop:1810 length:1362 start_codon:yes stop_codon:yes gene_type:complete